MQNEIIVNAEPGETRVAVLERSQFSELFIERDKDKSVVGSVVKGRVTRVLPGMQAAFVDIGLDKAAFLYAGDYFANGFTEDLGDAGAAPKAPQRRSRRNQPPSIDTLLKEQQEIVVQIAKQPIGTKGARIVSHVSIPGRHLVLTPWSRRVGVSRKIGSDRERRRLREIVERLRPKNLGFIIRTAGDGVREADLEADIRYLASVWNNIAERNDQARAPTVLHSEPDLPLRMIRDFAGTETKRIVVDSPQSYEAIQGFVEEYVAEPRPRIERYEGREPIFDAFSLEAQIHANLGRKVFLKSGGSLVVDHGEALTMIDVNTGRFVGKRDLEETVFKTNLEAVKEVVTQLRFRNIGGLIIIDLIDMESADHREKVYRALQEALRVDKARTNILKISELGLVEMTRKRTRENLMQVLCEPCAYCEGRGYVLSAESVAFRIIREIRKDLPRFCGRRIALTVAPQVAEELLRARTQVLEELGTELGRELEVRARTGLHQEQFEVEALDEGPPVAIPLSWLEELKPDEPDKQKAKDRSEAEDGENGSAGGSGRKSRRGRRRRGGSRSSSDDATTAEAADSEAAPAEGAGDGPEAVAARELDAASPAAPLDVPEIAEPDETENTAQAVAAPETAEISEEPLGAAEPAAAVVEEPPRVAAEAAAPEPETAPEPDASTATGSPEPVDSEAESRILPPSHEPAPAQEPELEAAPERGEVGDVDDVGDVGEVGTEPSEVAAAAPEEIRAKTNRG